MSNLKKLILKTSFEAGACHIGSALSCVGIIEDIFKKKRKRDIFLFGKASGVAAYYCFLAHKGVIKKSKLVDYLKNYPLASKEVPGVVHSIGSVGHALSVACGLAFADRSRDVYVLISDGEMNEGSTYEAALFAGHHKLKNLHVYCDDNGLQACGYTKDILNLETAFKFFKNTIPNFYRIKTIKGDGINFLHNKISSHYHNLTKSELSYGLWQFDQKRLNNWRKIVFSGGLLIILMINYILWLI